MGADLEVAGGSSGDLGGEGGAAEDALARALRRAIESGDTDLVYHVLFYAYRSRGVAELWQLASTRLLARNLLVKYCKARVSAGGARRAGVGEVRLLACPSAPSPCADCARALSRSLSCWRRC